MAKVKISELPILVSGSLSTILVGDDNGATYQIPLSVITASVVQMLSESADNRLDILEAFEQSFPITSASFDSRIKSGSTAQNVISSSKQISDLGFISQSTDITSLNNFTQSFNSFSSSVHTEILAGTNEQDLSNLVTNVTLGVLSGSVDGRLDSLELFTASYFTDSESIDNRLSSLEGYNDVDNYVTTESYSTDSASFDTRIQTLENYSDDDSRYATTGSNHFRGYQRIDGYVTASSFTGGGRYLTNLAESTDWNYNQEFTIRKTEQLTFSGDYVLDNTYLIIEGGTPNNIGEWEHRTTFRGGGISKTSNNTYLIEGPNFSGGASDGTLLTRYFDTETTMSVAYVWNSNDAGNEFPVYDITTGINNYPYEIGTPNMLQNPNASNESGTWIINVPADSYLTFAVWSGNSDNLTSTLQITLPYLFGEDIQYSPNKYFKKNGKIFIGGNLLVKDSYVENNGEIYVGGEVILIGNSQIIGTGTII